LRQFKAKFLVVVAVLALGALPVAAAPFDEAKALYTDSKFKEAYQVAAPLANEGMSDAQAMLGTMFENGRGVKKNAQTAAEWYLAAAKQKHVGAMFSLAMIFLDGRYGQVRDKEGKAWLEKAADGGHVPAMHNLALLFSGPRGGNRTGQKLSTGMKRQRPRVLVTRNTISACFIWKARVLKKTR